MSDTLLTVEEVVLRLKIDDYTVRKWLGEGKIKGAKIGGKLWRVKESDLEEFINAASFTGKEADNA
jgi:excisionase family DNA binding protein